MGQKQPKLKQDAVEELINQTSFSEYEIQDWYKGFLKECPSGHISVDEFKRIYSKFFPYGESTRFAEYVFRTFDRNHDGLIDFRDFLSSLSVTSRGDLTQKLRWAFTMYDLDGDGYISKQDLSEVLASIYALVGSTVEFPDDESTPERRADKIFLLMDLDRDDRLSLDEFITGVKSDQLLVRLLSISAQNSPQTPVTSSDLDLKSSIPSQSRLNQTDDNGNTNKKKVHPKQNICADSVNSQEIISQENKKG